METKKSPQSKREQIIFHPPPLFGFQKCSIFSMGEKTSPIFPATGHGKAAGTCFGSLAAPPLPEAPFTLKLFFFRGGRRLGASGMVPSHSPHWITEFCPPKFQGWEWMKCWKKNTLTSLLSSKSWGIFSALRPRSYCFSKVSSSYRPRRLQNDTKEDWKNACKSNITCQNAISVTSGFAPGPWNTWSEV